ncbi:tRNA (adenosine(37)-N6)-threonylcarbamoyltransferase complex transferase subunit TsaD [Salisediminibacterium beveridgei]|uniref:tRNA N6-adenosine threonylcarbamoyltransferase n=1 Tax=Salisediminibacterium beveridgei TaxID=632773 RepID=A0A1D7QYM8_9BACI|nr:tRNA (adenosine(37)-N6)-threonylcarbamoyltransferase complex transferase subunit TsaD [Salisediminibacterium beveridgei]AOM84116.1 putative tRNA threonylcarbamoyladenosine biosynthesis protein, YgjD/Kae1/Qri7 family [Salisediminibacterium beveridgei]
MKKEHNEIILAIETSCDETAAAVIEGGRVIRSNVVASQVESHKRFGGVVPEIASRHHVDQITVIIEEAVEQAGIRLEDLDAVAVTEGPGLIGALLVGVNAAKALAFTLDIPLIGVHHIAGHLYANHLVEPLTFPLVALVVSGGHTELIHMEADGRYEVMGETRDDAVGEAYDKVARTLGLPYPGGPHIDRLAHEGEETLTLPRSWLEAGSFDFSFSGLKSAVINTLHNARQRDEKIPVENLAASFQASVIDVLVDKTIRAVKEKQVNHLIVAGGVAANKGLRAALKDACGREGIQLTIPPLHLCTDNAAMIGAAAHVQYQQSMFSDDRLNGNPGLTLQSKQVQS